MVEQMLDPLVVLAAVALVVESQRETTQQAAQQVHLDKATQAAQALEVPLAVKRAAAVVVQGQLVLLLLSPLVVTAVQVLRPALRVLQ